MSYHVSSLQAADTLFPVVRHVVAHLSAEGIPPAPEGELYADIGEPVACGADHGHDLPSDEDLLSRRRHSRALATASSETAADSWLEEWSKRFNCWYLGLPIPTQTQLGSCMGALGLHLGSKLDASWRTAQLALGTPPKAVQPRAESAETGCDWLNDANYFDLPAFPEFPANELGFELPPIPRLLPTTQQLQSLVDQKPLPWSAYPKFMSRAAEGQFSSSADDGQQQSIAWSAVAGGGVGFAASAIFIIGFAYRGWMSRGCRREGRVAVVRSSNSTEASTKA